MAQEFNGDVNTRSKAITGTKQLVRTATVVVGLESMGYSIGQVDVLIKPTDNVATKLTEAINKLPPIGGEIKLLEGEYNLGMDSLTILKNNVSLIGTGIGTNITGGNTNINRCFNIIGGNILISNLNILSSVSEATIVNDYAVDNYKGFLCVTNCNLNNGTIWTQGNLIKGGTNITGCTNFRTGGKTASNWRNIFVDGVAEYVALNNTVDFVSDSTINLGTKVQIGDELTMQVCNPTYAIYRTLTYRISLEYMVINNIINVSPSTGNIVMFDANISSDLSNSQMYIQYVNSTLGGITPDPNFKLTYISFRRYSI